MAPTHATPLPTSWPSTPDQYTPRLQPRDGDLYAVRWIKRPGECAHRYFRRAHDAAALVTKLEGRGIPSRVFHTATIWAEANP